MARYFFQDEDAAKFETKANVVVVSAKRALTLGGCSTAGYLLEILVELKGGTLVTLQVFARSQNAMNQYLESPVSWLVSNTIQVGDMSRLWSPNEYVLVKDIA